MQVEGGLLKMSKEHDAVAKGEVLLELVDSLQVCEDDGRELFRWSCLNSSSDSRAGHIKLASMLNAADQSSKSFD